MGTGQDFAEQLTARMARHRGPGPGDGKGPGRRWAGIVEETPALWVTWVVDSARRIGVDPLALGVIAGTMPLRIETAQLTYGLRYYWRCPICGKRVEAVYIKRQVGCRRCLRLGYRSQTYRAASPYAVFDQLFSRDLFARRYADPGNRLDGTLDALQRALQGKIDELVRHVAITAA